MNKTLSEVIKKPEIEAIVYSEHDNPHSILGVHSIVDGYLINAFFPSAVQVEVVLRKGKRLSMERVDEAGFYSVIVPGKQKPTYSYHVVYDSGATQDLEDPYNFPEVITQKDREQFSRGIHYSIYEKLGAHPMKLKGTEGVLFAVWAPNAKRVSVVGDFNCWDGRRHPMRRLGDSGIFELFIPGLDNEMIYKYEIKTQGGLPVLKADPYANYAELRPANASKVFDLTKYHWTDEKWLDKRKRENCEQSPMVIYEVHLGSWRKPDIEGDNAFYNYRELAVMLAEYVKEMGYTHVELMPVMEHPFDGSWGYQVTGYYAVTARFGTPEDFMYFVDYMHSQDIGVILDWVPAHFPRDAFGLATFDGTCLYEHEDPRRGAHPHWGTLIFNYGRPEVSNFLIANALFWAEKYHIDGIRMDAVASMLYLNYGKEDGEWLPNCHGGRENLEAIELFKHLNSVMKKRNKGVVTLAEESTAWPKVTHSVEQGGLGFDFKWNMGWMNDFLDYMKTDPLFRKGKHGELTFSMVYAYSEQFVLVLSHDEVVHGKCSMINKMPGEYEDKFANLRTAYGFMMGHPGKKLLFMGQEFAQFIEWNEKSSLDWQLLEYESHRNMQHFVKVINEFYKNHAALYSTDTIPDGFEWLSCMDADHSVVAFSRVSLDKKETLVCVYNFTPVMHEDFMLGVPFHGSYKEILNSDAAEFGGGNRVNKRAKLSKAIPHDGRKESLTFTLPPLSMVVFHAERRPTAAEKKPVKKKETEKKLVEKKETEKKLVEKKETEKKLVEKKATEKKTRSRKNSQV